MRKIKQKIYEIVKTVPRGYVITYGEVAKRAGDKNISRYVGYLLHNNPDPNTIPCHRVVFSTGKLSQSFAFGGELVQQKLLINEGITFKNGKVDMEKHMFKAQ